MKNLSISFSHEIQVFLSWKNLAAWVIILVLFFINVNSGINDIKNFAQKIRDFKQIHDNYFKKTNNYELYGRDGIKFLYVHASTWLLSGNTVIPPDLMAKVDSLVTVQLYNSYKGKSLAPGSFSGRLDYGGIISLFICLMALWYGFRSFKNPEFMLFLSGIRSSFLGFICSAVVRFIIFALAFIFTQMLLYIFVLLRGIEFSPSDYSGLLASLSGALVMIFIFFFIGAFIARFGQRSGSYIALLLVWVIMNLGTSWLINAVTDPSFPDANKDFRTELEKYNKLMNFEEISEKKYGKFDRKKIEVARQVAKNYLESDYPAINSFETGLKEELRESIGAYNRWCLWFPTGFFRQTVNEASSGGYGNYLDFYDYVQEKQGEFVRFYIERTYYGDPKQMVNFIKDDEDIFRGKSYLPPGFRFGLLLNFCYGLIFLLLSFYGYKSLLYPKEKSVSHFSGDELALESNKKVVISSDNEKVLPQLRKVFLGAPGRLNLHLTLDKKNLAPAMKKDCIYVLKPALIPGEMKTRHVMRILKHAFKPDREKSAEIEKALPGELLRQKWGKIGRFYQYKLVLLLVKYCKHRIILLEDFAVGFPHSGIEELYEILESMDLENKVLIDLVCKGITWFHSIDIKYTIYSDLQGKQYTVKRSKI